MGGIDEAKLKDMLDGLLESWSALADPVARMKKIIDEHPTMVAPEWPRVRKELLKALDGLQTVVKGRCLPPTVSPGTCGGVSLSVMTGRRSQARKKGST